MAAPLRIQKIDSLIQTIVSSLLQENLADKGIGLITVVRVETAADMSQTTAFISAFDKTLERRAVLKAIKRIAPAMQRELGMRLATKKVPLLRFQFDERQEKIDRIDELLREQEKNL